MNIRKPRISFCSKLTSCITQTIYGAMNGYFVAAPFFSIASRASQMIPEDYQKYSSGILYGVTGAIVIIAGLNSTGKNISIDATEVDALVATAKELKHKQESREKKRGLSVVIRKTEDLLHFATHCQTQLTSIAMRLDFQERKEMPRRDLITLLPRTLAQTAPTVTLSQSQNSFSMSCLTQGILATAAGGGMGSGAYSFMNSLCPYFPSWDCANPGFTLFKKVQYSATGASSLFYFGFMLKKMRTSLRQLEQLSQTVAKLVNISETHEFDNFDLQTIYDNNLRQLDESFQYLIAELDFVRTELLKNDFHLKTSVRRELSKSLADILHIKLLPKNKKVTDTIIVNPDLLIRHPVSSEITIDERKTPLIPQTFSNHLTLEDEDLEEKSVSPRSADLIERSIRMPQLPASPPPPPPMEISKYTQRAFNLGVAFAYAVPIDQLLEIGIEQGYNYLKNQIAEKLLVAIFPLAKVLQYAVDLYIGIKAYQKHSTKMHADAQARYHYHSTILQLKTKAEILPEYDIARQCERKLKTLHVIAKSIEKRLAIMSTVLNFPRSSVTLKSLSSSRASSVSHSFQEEMGSAIAMTRMHGLFSSKDRLGCTTTLLDRDDYPAFAIAPSSSL